MHETIAKAEIDQLLEPKIFVNATKYDQENLDGTPVDTFDFENFIIKGNNLIALHSLKERYAGKAKLIYLDIKTTQSIRLKTARKGDNTGVLELVA